MRTASSPLLRLRARLVIGTALGSLAASPALSQSLPVPGDATPVLVEGGSNPSISPGGTGRLNVDLRARNTVIDWNGFNIPESERIDFRDDRVVSTGNIAVLNRDISTRPSQLLGRLTSDSNVAVWVYNPNGILVGERAAFNTGSLVLTTLDPDVDAFRNNRSTYRMTADATSSAGVTVLNGAQIRTQGGNRGLVMVAPRIDAHGQFEAIGQDIAFVTASDVTLSFSQNSPLSVTLHRGTAVGGTSQYVRGSVAGNEAIFALASQGTITDSLLQVDASVTTATAGDRGIILSAGASARPIGGVALDSAGDNSGIASLVVNGNLTTEDGGSDIRAVATGSARFLGDLDSRGEVRLEADGALEVAGAVEARDDYLLVGHGVTLGALRSGGVSQVAGGRIEISSIDGDIVGRNVIELRANGDGANVDLSTGGTIGGNILLGRGASIFAGSNRSGNLNILALDAAHSVSLGNLSANAIRGAVGSGVFTNGLALTGTLALGNVDVREAIALNAGSIATGSLSSGRSITLDSLTGGITTGTITTTGTNNAVSVRAPGGGISVSSVNSSGAVLIDGLGALTVGGDVTANGALTLRGASVRFNGARASSARAIDILARSGGISSAGGFALTSSSGNSADFIRLQAGGPEGIVFGDGSAITAGSGRALRVGLYTAADAPLALGNVTARSLGMLAALDGDATQAGGAIVSAASLRFGNLDLVDGFTAESTGGDLSIAQIGVSGAGQGISVRASNGTLSVQNSLSASGDVTLASGNGLQLGAVESRNGRATLTSAGAVTLTTLAGATGARVEGASLNVGTLLGGSGAVSAVANTGNATLNRVEGTSVDISAAAGALSLSSIDASGAITLSARNDLTATGPVETSGGLLSATAASGAVSLTGGTRATGDTTLSGLSIALGGEHRTGGAYSATARAGNITGAFGLSILSDSNGSGGEALSLSATSGGVLLDAATSLRGGQGGGSAIAIIAGGGSVRFGNATGARLSISGATDIATRDLTLGGDLSLAAANGVSTGAISVGPGAVTIDGGAGATTTGAITSGGAVALTGATLDFGQIEGASLSAIAASSNAIGGNIFVDGSATVRADQGAVTLGRVRADSGNVAISALGPMTLGGIFAGGGATLSTSATGAGIQITDGLEATDSISVMSGGDIRAPFIRSYAGDLNVAAPNGGIGGIGGGLLSLQAGAGRAFSLTIGEEAELGDIVGSQISITATSLIVGSINSNGEAIALNSTAGDLNVQGTLRGGSVSASATGAARLGAIDATGAVSLNGGTFLSFGDVGGASVIGRSGGAIEGGTIRSGGAVDMAGGRLTLGNVIAGGPLSLGASSGDIDVAALEAAGNVIVDAAGVASIRGAVSAGGDYRASGTSVILGDSGVEQRANGAVHITARQGDISGASGLTLVSDADASAEAEGIVLDAAGGISLADSSLQARPGGGATLGIRAGSGQAIRLGAIEAGRIGGYDGTTVTSGITHNAEFTAGDIRTGAFAVSLSGGNIAIGEVMATGAVSLETVSGTLSIGDIASAALDLSAGGALFTGSIDASGDVALEGDTIDIGGQLAAARQLLLRARQALTLGDVSSGGAMTLEGGGALTAGLLNAGGALSLTSGGDLTLGGATAAGAIRIEANGTARLGALTGAPSIDIIANDAELSGAIRARAVSFTNRRGADGALRIGDDTATDGFRLSDAEVALISTDSLRFDAGAGSLEIGTLNLAPGAGGTIEMLGTSDVRVNGTLFSDDIARTIRIGGNADGTADATSLHVIATSSAGGRLLVEGADLDLRANRIAVGLAPGFIDTLVDGPEGLAQANALIGNPNSSLYNPLLGGGFYDPDATVTVAARSMSLRIGEYALFQNTAIPGQLSGIQLGGTPDAPVAPALRIGLTGPASGASFAMFGMINGIGDATAALLGSPVLDIDPRLLPGSRINGCLAGSGVGCLTTIVIQPTLQVFRWDSEDIFGISSDVAVPFAPIVSGNNEELLTSLPALLPEQPAAQEEDEHEEEEQ